MDRTDERLATIVLALEQRVAELEEDVTFRDWDDYTRGRLDEAADQLANIRILAQPSLVEAQT